MKEFLVGLLALFFLVLAVGAYYLLLPLIMLLGVVLQIIVVILLGLFSIWLLGKGILILFTKEGN